MVDIVVAPKITKKKRKLKRSRTLLKCPVLGIVNKKKNKYQITNLIGFCSKEILSSGLTCTLILFNQSSVTVCQTSNKRACIKLVYHCLFSYLWRSIIFIRKIGTNTAAYRNIKSFTIGTLDNYRFIFCQHGIISGFSINQSERLCSLYWFIEFTHRWLHKYYQSIIYCESSRKSSMVIYNGMVPLSV